MSLAPSGSPPRVLMIDNRDSFVFNLVDELARAGAQVITVRGNIEIRALEHRLASLDPDLVVLSPGPGRPEDAGVMVPWLQTEPEVPVLGVCLGHQALAVAAGGRVERAPRPVHGRTSVVDLSADPLFDGMTAPVRVARYHSLVVTRVPESMKVVATTRDAGKELIMAIRHHRLCRVGLQFHPESILTPAGGQWVTRFLREALAWKHARSQTVSSTERGETTS